MSDERRRAAERARDVEPTLEAEVRAVVEGLRAGRLLPERVRLAARLGHAAAQRVTGVSDPRGVGVQDPRVLVGDLYVRWHADRETLLRAALATVRLARSALGERQGEDLEELPWIDALALAGERWAQCPCEAHADAARDALARAAGAGQLGDGPSRALAIVVGDDASSPLSDAAAAVQWALLDLLELRAPGETVEDVGRRMCAAIRGALIAWLVGETP